MLSLYINDPSYEYDVYNLVKAFYPREGIRLARSEGEAVDLRVEVGESNIRVLFNCEDVANPQARAREGVTRPRNAAYRASIGGWEGPARELEAAIAQDLGRKEIKNILKITLYDLLVEATSRTLPWGTLTGVRPTKIAFGLLEQGAAESEIAEYMRTRYRTSEEKISLALGIASRERELLSRIELPDEYSLYIGIPFCPSICLYCSFASSPIAAWKTKVDDYLDALCREIDYVAEAFSDRPLRTIYIGGGTPTSLDEKRLERLLSYIDERLDRSHLLEYTVEAGRPDSITAEKLAIIRAHGIERISINPQTMNDATLRRIGRAHTAEDIRQAFLLAREAGFSHINADLIAGLPDEGIDEIKHTISEIEALRPDNLTVHSLAIKRSSRLAIEWESYADSYFHNSEEILGLFAESAARMGMSPYYMYRQKNIAGNLENTGYAPVGREGLYNMLIMEEREDIVALGAGADSKRIARHPDGTIDRAGKVTRCENVKNVDAYISRIDEMIDRKRRLFFE